MVVMADVAAAAELEEETTAERIERLYRLHAPSTHRLAYLLVGDAATADDLTQEAFERVLGSIGGLRSEAALPAYHRRTLVNLARSRHRSLTRERLRMERVARRDVVPVRDEEDGELWDAVQALPQRQRAAVVLRYWLDLGDRDIASALRCRESTVRSLLSRALGELRTEVQND